jgi:hypothetical protein
MRKWYDLSRMDDPDFPRTRGDWVMLMVVVAIAVPSIYVSMVVVLSL